MKKDINIPKVDYLQLAIVSEFNSDFRVYDWNVYLINEKKEPLEMVLIVIEGKDSKRKTALTRHKIENFPAESIAKIEYMPDEILVLNNTLSVSFFYQKKLHEKSFIIKKNSISKSKANELSLFRGNYGFIID